MAIFNINDDVSLKNNSKRHGPIVDKERVGNEIYYTVSFPDQEEKYEESILQFYIEKEYISLKDMAKNRDFISLDEFKKKYLLAKINFHLPDIFYETIASTADFLPYQFRPLMKILDNYYGRLLIADEVGIGKTIEAGYIISELLGRREIESILIVCPKNLVGKWKLEMKRFFNEDFEMVNDGKDLLIKFKNRLKYPKLIVGLELTRRREIVNLLEKGLIDDREESFHEYKPFNMVVFDEAHHLRHLDTLSHEVGKIFLEDCDYALFLTATPINTKLEDLMNLLNLLVYQGELTPSEFNDMMEPNRSFVRIQVLLDELTENYLNKIKEELKKLSRGNSFSRMAYEQIEEDGNLIKFLEDEKHRTPEIRAEIRYSLEQINQLSEILNNTRKRDIADHESLFPIRHPEDPVLVEFTEPERKFYIKARQFFIDLIIRRAEGSYVPIQLVEVMPQRVVASSINGTFQKLKKMLENHQNGIDQSEDLIDFEDLEYQERDIVLNANPFLLIRIEIETIGQLLEYEQIIGDTDSKFDAALNKIREYFLAGNSQIIIFSYFKATIEYITERLNNADFSKEEKTLGHSIRAEYIHGDINIPMRDQIFRQFERNEIQILILSEIGAEGIDLQFCNCIINYDLPWNPMKLEQRIGRLDRYKQKSAIFITNIYIKNSIEDRILHRLYRRIKLVRENLMFLNPVLTEFFETRKEMLYKPGKTEEEIEEALKKIEENLEVRKKDRKIIEDRVEEMKGNTSKALLYEENLVEKRSNPFSLEDLFETINYILQLKYPDSCFKQIQHADEDTKKYLDKKNIPISDSLYWFKTSSSFSKKISALDVQSENFKEEINQFAGRIDDALAPPRKKRFTPILITYDKELAKNFPQDIYIISLKHTLVKILLFNIKDERFKRLCTSLKTSKKSEFKSVLLVIYLLKIEGIRKESKIEISGYDFNSKLSLSKESAMKIFRELTDKDFNFDPDPKINEDLIDEGFNKCFSEVVYEKGQIENRLKSKITITFEYKREQIKNRYEHRIEKSQASLNKVRSNKIKRLFQGHIDKFKRRKEELLQSLKEKYDKSIVISIVEIGSIIINYQ